MSFVNEDCIEEEGYLEDGNCPCKDVCPLISCSGAILAYENIITLFIYLFLKKNNKKKRKKKREGGMDMQ